mmetsp:Transcript_18968/g.30805  ORF Transcript_18968/g.30805 Transcript_18968/m.30805 type:complete len:359 (-) Transcript_18968:135-1211(-)|eukprot:CAMPEP_0169108332 /NCGR_PEP_ID=MMETSP1015-20121227/25371_1 /TAXON_ID=342587 /ORGANISM="Karlodinium micrum, Strain CCMP2283" /LENGTH=358 /DNA_ID=CAMNT_0009169947 /DNA_START=81 /DNA_END=1157 /DNA_ORIENTATION=+
MRFGKKLALQVTDDSSGAPYLSHKNMKEAINKTVRELRVYQSKVQSNDNAWKGSGMPTEAATPEEIAELETRVAALDAELFALVDEDLEKILAHVRQSEALLAQRIAVLQELAINIGLILEESQIEQIEKALPVPPESRTVLCQKLLELRIRSEPTEVKERLEDIARRYNLVVDVANKHSQYLEINVAGFRKLLKRHEKQIPQSFHSRPTPFLGFHHLVTHTSRQLLDMVRQLGDCFLDAWERLAVITRMAAGEKPQLIELKSLGAECQMVLEIQKQLKAGLKDVPHDAHLLAGGHYSQPEPSTYAPQKAWSLSPTASDLANASVGIDLQWEATHQWGGHHPMAQLTHGVGGVQTWVM